MRSSCAAAGDEQDEVDTPLGCVVASARGLSRGGAAQGAASLSRWTVVEVIFMLSGNV